MPSSEITDATAKGDGIMSPSEGRFRLVPDVFLHETVHQWQHEVRGDLEGSYHGHGPKFRSCLAAC